MKKFLVAASLAAVIAAMSVPAQAAANVVVAGPGAAVTASAGLGFLTPQVVLTASAPGTFIQADPLAPHDITERPVGAPSNYQPKFWTTVAQPPGTYPIQWRANVQPGTYRFVCSVHTNMVGMAEVV